MDFYNEREWRILPLFCEHVREDNVGGKTMYYVDVRNKEDIVLLVAPKDYVPILINDLKSIVTSKYGNDEINFSIIAFDDLHKF